ncbi:MAG: carboxypeptidase-like regulatory domain-containing protein [Fibrobacteria bacterium]
MKMLTGFTVALGLLPASLFAATISGTVSTGGTASAPIASAKVVLTIAGGGGGGAGTRLDSTITDADGKYSFTTDSLGFRQIQASATGYSNGTGTVNVNKADSAFTVNIRLASSAPGKVIGTVVTGAAPGTPLENATVILRRTTGGGSTFTPDTLKTDAAGAYAFDSVPANTNYTLLVSLSGYETITRNAVTVLGGETVTQNFTLAPPPPPGSIAGTVYKASDSATVLAGARVILTRTGGGSTFRPDTLLTDEDGKYAFDSVPVATNYFLSVSLSGYVSQTRTGIAVTTGAATAEKFYLALIPAPGSIAGTVVKASDSATALPGARVILNRFGGGLGFQADTVLTGEDGKYKFDSVAVATGFTLSVSLSGYETITRAGVAVTSGAVTTVNFALVVPPAPGSIAGKITKAADAGALAGARIILTRTGGGTPFPPDTTVSDESGLYAFDGIPNQGGYVLTVSDSGFGTVVSSNLQVAGGLKTTANIALSEIASGDTTGTVKGMVMGTGHAPVSGARVILSRLGGGGGAGTAVDTVMTDSTGKFAFEPQNPGNYRVSVSASGYQNGQSGTIALAAAGTFIANLDLTVTASLREVAGRHAPGRSYWSDGRMVVDLDASKQARAVAVFGTDGRLLHRVGLEAGALRVTLPADIKPGMRILLRLEY